jgi:Protein of unknown function (DUF3574)
MRLALLALLAILAGCAPCRETLLAQLYFGRALPGGGEVGEAAWAEFVADELSARFPAGFTVLDAQGQWREEASGRVLAERTKLVQIAAPDSAETVQRLDALRAAYRARFGQDAVGLVTAPACAEF